MHTIDIPAWARERAMCRLDQIDPTRTALVVVDMQTAFLVDSPLANPIALEIVPAVNRLSQALRAAGGTVAFTRHTVSDDPRFRLTDWEARMSVRAQDGSSLFQDGGPGHEVYPGLDVQPADIVINKHRFSPFMANSSDLDALLKAKGIDTLIVTGTVTNVCCETTARDGHMMGYKIVFVSDATAALTDAEHNATLLSMTAIFAEVRDTDGTIHLISG